MTNVCAESPETVQTCLVMIYYETVVRGDPCLSARNLSKMQNNLENMISTICLLNEEIISHT